VATIFVIWEVEVWTMFKCKAEASAEEERVAATVGHISEGKLLV